jgi:sugar lactone lactonase YvrE
MAIGGLLLASLAGVAGAAGGISVAKGFNGPQGVMLGPDGSIYVVDSGVGGEQQMTMKNPEDNSEVVVKYGNTARVVKIAPDGGQTVLATLPSFALPQDTSGGARLAMLDGVLYVTTAVWTPAQGDEAMPLTGSVARVDAGGATDAVKIWPYEKANNPDGTMIDTHPYGLVAGPDGRLWVADAGGNAVYRTNPADGSVELVTAFKQGVPVPFENPVRGGATETDPVPTGIVVGADGAIYVSWLPGAPFLPGSSKVVRLGNDGSATDYATGLTMVTDVRKGPDGQLYGVQFGQFADKGPVPNSGSVIRIKAGAASETLVSGLSFPTSIDFNSAGDAFVTINGVGAPGSGELVRYDSLTAASASAAAAPSTLPTTGWAATPAGLAVWFGLILLVGGVTLRRRSLAAL